MAPHDGDLDTASSEEAFTPGALLAATMPFTLWSLGSHLCSTLRDFCGYLLASFGLDEIKHI